MTALPSDLREAVETVRVGPSMAQRYFKSEFAWDRYHDEMTKFRAALALIEQRLMEYERALREITQTDWHSEGWSKETPFQFEQRLHKIAADVLMGSRKEKPVRIPHTGDYEPPEIDAWRPGDHRP